MVISFVPPLTYFIASEYYLLRISWTLKIHNLFPKTRKGAEKGSRLNIRHCPMAENTGDKTEDQLEFASKSNSIH